MSAVGPHTRLGRSLAPAARGQLDPVRSRRAQRGGNGPENPAILGGLVGRLGAMFWDTPEAGWGSHAAPVPPIDPHGFGSGMGPHPDEVRVMAPAGSAILFTSGSIWHRARSTTAPAPASRSLELTPPCTYGKTRASPPTIAPARNPLRARRRTRADTAPQPLRLAAAESVNDVHTFINEPGPVRAVGCVPSVTLTAGGLRPSASSRTSDARVTIAQT